MKRRKVLFSGGFASAELLSAIEHGISSPEVDFRGKMSSENHASKVIQFEAFWCVAISGG